MEEQYQDINELLHKEYEELISKEHSIIRFAGHAGDFYYITDLMWDNPLILDYFKFKYSFGSAYYNYQIPQNSKYKKGKKIQDEIYQIGKIYSENICLTSEDDAGFMLSEETYNFFINEKIAMRDNQFFLLENYKKYINTYNVHNCHLPIEHKELILLINTADLLKLGVFDILVVNNMEGNIQKIQLYDFIGVFNKDLNLQEDSIIRIIRYEIIK